MNRADVLRFVQQGPVLTDRLLDGLDEVLPDVPPVRDVHGVRRGEARSAHDTASKALYAEAAGTASRSGSQWRRAVVHMSHALVALYSTPGPQAANALIDAAVRDARAGESITVRVRAHALQLGPGRSSTRRPRWAWPGTTSAVTVAVTRR